MPATKPTPAELPSDDLILAAIERAERHRRRDDPGETLPTIKQHLGLPHTGWTTRQLRPGLGRLQAAGLIDQVRRYGLNLWTLTPKGKRRAAAVRSRIALPGVTAAPPVAHSDHRCS